MNVLDLIDRLIDMGHRDWWPVVPDASIDDAVLMTASAISLSGMLDDVTDEDDMRAAVDHFNSLINSGIIDKRQWAEEMHIVDRALQRWGQELDAHQERMAAQWN